MKFEETHLKGAFVISLEKKGDDRGFFARLFCTKEFQSHGLATSFVQINNSLSASKGTLRGMHYQLPPHAEVKVVRCVKGALYDVIVDLRAGSPTLGQSFGITLTAENRKMLYVPQGFAHGFITLEDQTEAFYLVSAFYDQPSERGLRWNDPVLKIHWPFPPTTLSDKDMKHPDFKPQDAISLKE